ncbi:MAG: hypothetical protein ACMG6E_05335 [Candidatus Roizmanbacteria bacterium]
MDALLNHILTQLAGENPIPSISKDENDFSITYIVTADKTLYPTLVGKKGTTIKALITLLRSFARSASEDSKKIFITVTE